VELFLVSSFRKMINSNTSLYGLVGFPVKHSFSPLMHNYFFEKEGINAVYLCFETLPEQVKHLKNSIISLGIKGLNVTVPYKRKVMGFLDKLDPKAELIGAVNTIKADRGKLTGFNTDGIGFVRSLKEKAKFDIKGREAVILGSGGAAKSISVYLAEEEAGCLGLFDIKVGRAKKLAEEIKRRHKELKVKVYNSEPDIDLNDASLLVNATGLGMKKNDPLPLDPKKLGKNLLVYDLTYNPSNPVLLREAERRGCKVMNGLWMLIYQGLASLEIWLDRDLEGKETILYRPILRYVRS